MALARKHNGIDEAPRALSCGDGMKCPDCGCPYNCPCEACAKNKPNDLPKWIRLNVTPNDWDEACPRCGIIQSVHAWMEEEYRQYKAVEMGE